ncbi:hypothetical protein ACIBHX_49140 [Nonomuraea sp. NPDC050536]|uniref:hypothetical protein n=1 Tax=Nonomuraea sp. NPDC050536 TaxID=3364366 RepID=UPI0037C72FF8
MIEEAGIPLRHFVLHTDEQTLKDRIEHDTPEIRPWRLAHVPRYFEALPWL